ncbi:hypothetical protein [Mesorhizobium sp. M0898]|uniref:hypothetical protein n=1 Tax=Mesorhizobium sp. M0898 TaxID=2957020 RepID=UPI00333B2B55
MSQLSSLLHFIYSSPNFVPGIVGVTASFAGAWGAQVSILRREQKREKLASVRAFNEALALSFAIGNNFMSLKSQHLMGMLERFRETEKNVQAHLQRILASKPSDKFEPIACAMELHTLPISKVPIERLETVVFEKITVDTKTLNLVIEIHKAIDALNTSIRTRNELIQKWLGEGPTVNDSVRTIRYLGIHTDKGADETYKQTLFAIEKYCDDCIYFTTRLDVELNKRGNKMRRYRFPFFNPLPQIAEADFSSERAQRLMPDAKEYEDWESGFVKPPTFRDKLTKLVRRKNKKITPPKSPEA